jgi:hypothetical protein
MPVSGLVMPTMIQGHNGATISQRTPIRVVGCHAIAMLRIKHEKHGGHTKRHKRGK